MSKYRFHSFEAMCKWIFFTWILLLINIIDQCSGDSHSITSTDTNSEWYNGYTPIDRVLFVRNLTSPKSYEVRFKYVGDAYSNFVSSARIYSDAEDTNGGGSINNGLDIHDYHYLNAHIHITNASNFQVGVTVQALRGSGYMRGFSRWTRVKEFRPRSSAAICAINKSQPHTKYRKLIFGERKANDVILYARQSFTPADEEMPRHKIEYQDNNAIITAVEIKLNSTKAIVFHNKVKMTEHRFSGTVYGLNRDTITDVVIIYGHKSNTFHL